VIKENLAKTNKNELVDILSFLLSSYCQPSFGTLPKSEIDLLMLESLIDIKYISKEPQVYELVSKLKVTSTKARKLIYERELRKYNENELDDKVKQILINPIIQKNGELFLFEVENPLLVDHIKNRLKSLEYLSDGSFSPSIIKLSSKAMNELVKSYIDKKNIKKVERILSKKGIEQPTIKGFVVAGLKKLARKAVDDVGDDMIESTEDFLGTLLSNNISTSLINSISNLLLEENNE
jgi:hypothetical protein